MAILQEIEDDVTIPEVAEASVGVAKLSLDGGKTEIVVPSPSPISDELVKRIVSLAKWEFGIQLDDVVHADTIKGMSEIDIVNVFNCWEEGNPIREKLLTEWAKRFLDTTKNEWNDVVPSSSLEDNSFWLTLIKRHMADTRRHVIYNNIERLKECLRQVIKGDEQAEEAYKDFLTSCQDIERVRQELKGYLKACYDLEMQAGGSPDPLLWQDYVGDITK